MRYKYLEDVALADVAFESYGESAEECICNAGLALEDVQADLATVELAVTRRMSFQAPAYEDLLLAFLEELVYLKDAQQLVFAEFSVQIKGSGPYTLEIAARGSHLDDAVKQKTDVKAVTRHLFTIKKMQDQWVARVVLDV